VVCVAVSTDCVADMRAWGADFVAGGLLPNCVDAAEVAALASTDALHAARTDLAGEPSGSTTEDEHTVVAVGALSWEKGHDVLLRAIAHLDVTRPGLRLAILGEGVERARLVALAHELGIERRLVLAGHRSDPWRWLGGASLFVHPSRWEGFGMSLLEAMAAGLPAIATSCPGGPKEILENGRHGLVVAAEDHRELGDAIGLVLGDPDLRACLGSQAQLRAADYAPARVAEMLIAALCG
jgi:glycosyltransferase involved in cell wall biosynthesis